MMRESEQRVSERWPFLVADREILGGSPRFAGTHVALAALEARRGEGGRLLAFLDDHPDVSPCDAAAAWMMPQAEMEEAIRVGLHTTGEAAPSAAAESVHEG